MPTVREAPVASQRASRNLEDYFRHGGPVVVSASEGAKQRLMLKDCRKTRKNTTHQTSNVKLFCNII